MAMTPDKLKAMFNDLGKATKRGIRKCPRCGTINGTRGMQCKNRECEYVFKEGNKKPSQISNAVKVVTGSSVQVFSVSIRERGQDFRGFVQLPLIQDLDGNPAENIEPSIMMSVLSTAAKCYVETCPRSKQQNTESSTIPVCNHIKGSVNCTEEAQPLTLKNSVLNALDIEADSKEAIWLLATETSGPLVQRVTKKMFIIKCKPSTKHPLGFLHFAFITPGDGKKKEAVENRFICTCKQLRPKTVLSAEESRAKCIHFYACIAAIASDEGLAEEFKHFLAMTKFNEIVAEALETTVVFAGGGNIILNSDSTSQDKNEQNMNQFETLGGESYTTESSTVEHVEQIDESGLVEMESETSVGIHDHLGDAEDSAINDDEEEILLEGQETQVSTLEDPGGSGDSSGLIISTHPNIMSSEAVITQSEGEESAPDDVTNVDNIEVIVDDHNQIVSITEPQAKRQKLENLVLVSEASDTIAAASSALLTLQETSTDTVPNPAGALDTVLTTSQHSTPDFKIMGKKTPVKPQAQKTLVKKTAPHDEGGSLQITFQQWLASVTERINQTMHYQFDGIPDPLVFHAPQVFFDCLQARISAGSKKKRLPNSTTGFIRRDALPLGTFTKYTWHITNILHVKQIFDTPELHLDITRSFVENKDGTFDLYDKAKDSTAQSSSDGKNNYLPIRPFELKTYLKVGHTSPNQKEATPFVIEWIPDILPKTRIGELRIKFEYGHQRNGHVEHRTTSLANI